jgi:hypothetical protein
MKMIVYLLGFGNVVLSVLLILYTRETVDAFKKVFRSFPLKLMALVPAVVGLLFLISAGSIAYPWVFIVVGILALGEAVLAFTNPRNLYNRLLDWYFDKVSDQTQRFFGIIGIIFGTAILTWIK